MLHRCLLLLLLLLLARPLFAEKIRSYKGLENFLFSDVSVLYNSKKPLLLAVHSHSGYDKDYRTADSIIHLMDNSSFSNGYEVSFLVERYPDSKNTYFFNKLKPKFFIQSQFGELNTNLKIISHRKIIVVGGFFGLCLRKTIFHLVRNEFDKSDPISVYFFTPGIYYRNKLGEVEQLSQFIENNSQKEVNEYLKLKVSNSFRDLKYDYSASIFMNETKVVDFSNLNSGKIINLYFINEESSIFTNL